MYAGQAHICSFLIPIEAFYNIGFFDPELRAAQDFYLWFKFVDAGYLFFYISEILIVWRLHLQQVTLKKYKICIDEELKKWDFANKLFYDDIKRASKSDQKIFKKKKSRIINSIKHIVYFNTPFFVRKIWRIAKCKFFHPEKQK
jgi:hypothetical protein